MSSVSSTTSSSSSSPSSSSSAPEDKKTAVPKNDRLVLIVEEKDKLYDSIAEYIVNAGEKAIKERGKFHVAFSGGNMPMILGKGLSAIAKKRTDIHWSKWHVYLVDERLVAADHSDSNYRQLCEAFLSSLVPKSNHHPIKFSLISDPDACAAAYEKEIVEAVGKEAQLDLIMLGIGPDGHTASLFPKHALLKEEKKLVASIVDSPKPPSKRITMTRPLLYRAHQVTFISTGSEKQTMLPQVWSDFCKPMKERTIPSAMIETKNGNPIVWLCDSTAVKL
eukprot:TRINITY_DN6219_c0_g1_i1.p1 TRINITY_DN6219_c0_g1~~TRINITY_DN6219_c0_g1_i1.p1  ORF type:complete len:278 (+),score=86.17 TRINITY_DN6219_c0_g1_i1:72-905(+)